MAKRFTGPGKVQDNLNRTPAPIAGGLHSFLCRTQPTPTPTPARPPAAFLPRFAAARPAETAETRGLLYNFDVEGDELKDEHRRWLDDQVVPHLRAGAARLRLVGTASRTGGDRFNLDLSARRVEAVKAHLLGRGVDAGLIQTAAAGERSAAAAGQADGTDRAEDRAVGCQLTHTPTPGKPKLARYFEGYWDEHTPDGIDLEHAQVVHLPADRTAYFKVSNAVGKVLSISNTGLAQVFRVPLSGVDTKTGKRTTNGNPENMVGPLLGDVDPLFIAIHGYPGPGGDTGLVSTASNVEDNLLRVAVLKPVTVRVKFWRVVRDAANNKSERSDASIKKMLETAQFFWTPQANVEFESLGIQEVPFKVEGNRNGGPLVVNDEGGMEGDFIPFGQHGGNLPGQVNVYFVKALDTTKKKFPGGVTLKRGSNVILIRDNLTEFKEDGIVLAHELGHAFSLPHLGADPLYLMVDGKIPEGYKLRGSQIDEARAYLLNQAAYVKKG